MANNGSWKVEFLRKSPIYHRNELETCREKTAKRISTVLKRGTCNNKNLLLRGSVLWMCDLIGTDDRYQRLMGQRLRLKYYKLSGLKIKMAHGYEPIPKECAYH